MVGRGHRAQSPVEHIDDQASGAIEDPDARRAVRARRPTPERIARVEVRVDGVEKRLERMDGKLDGIVEYAARADAERERRSAADAVALERRRKFLLSLISALGAAAALVIGAFAKGCL